MTVEELWQNLKPLISKVDNLESKVDKLEPLVGKVSNLETEVYGIKESIHDMEGSIHQIKDVNMTTLIKLQTETIQEIKATNKKLDNYIQQNEVKHKEFEYKIAKLEWKNQIANAN